MRAVGRYAAVGVVALSIGACGSSISGPPPTAETACNDYAAKVCERARACEPGVLPFFGYEAPADCVSGLAAACQSALAEPHTGYTPARAQACGNALGAMTCAAFLGQATAPACLPRGGTIPVGGSCRDGWQCASGSCHVSDYTMCGTCVEPAPLGEACSDTECADNLVCSGSTSDGVGFACTTPVGIGGDCNSSGVCPFNAQCDQVMRICTKLPALGEACDPTAIFFCDPTTSAAICNGATSLCEAIVTVQPGEVCTGAATTCVGGVCIFAPNSDAGTCIATVPDGGSCASTVECVFPSSCVGGTCQPLVCDGTPTSTAATALAATSPLSSRRRGSVVGRSRLRGALRRP